MTNTYVRNVPHAYSAPPSSLYSSSSSIMPVLTEELAHLRRDDKGGDGHRWQVSSLEFSPNGALLASGSWDKEVRVWDLSTLETALVLKGVHEVPVTSVSWHRPTGSLLCVGSADCTASLWNARDGSYLTSLEGHTGWVLDVCFSCSSQILATASWDSTIKLWDSVKNKQISTLAQHSKVCLVLSLDRILVTNISFCSPPPPPPPLLFLLLFFFY